MAKELSKIRYLFLLEKDQKGESLSPSENQELADYQAGVSLYLTYNRRFEYFTLFENYLQGKIDLENFYQPFYRLFYQDMLDSKSLSCDLEKLSNIPMDFEITSKCKQFYALIAEIWDNYEYPYEEEILKSIYDSNYQPDFESIIKLIHKNYRKIKELLK